MNRSEIEKIIVKFLDKEANIQELDVLDTWLRNDGNLETFNHFAKIEYITLVGMTEYDIDRAKEAIKQKLKDKERKRKSKKYAGMAVAASIALIFGTLFFKMDEGGQEVQVSDVVPA